MRFFGNFFFGLQLPQTAFVAIDVSPKCRPGGAASYQLAFRFLALMLVTFFDVASAAFAVFFLPVLT